MRLIRGEGKLPFRFVPPAGQIVAQHMHVVWLIEWLMEEDGGRPLAGDVYLLKQTRSRHELRLGADYRTSIRLAYDSNLPVNVRDGLLALAQYSAVACEESERLSACNDAYLFAACRDDAEAVYNRLIHRERMALVRYAQEGLQRCLEL